MTKTNLQTLKRLSYLPRMGLAIPPSYPTSPHPLRLASSYCQRGLACSRWLHWLPAEEVVAAAR
jgi:hypothetical protein